MTLPASRIREALAAGRRNPKADAPAAPFGPPGQRLPAEIFSWSAPAETCPGASRLETVLGAMRLPGADGEQVLVERRYAFEQHPGLDLWQSGGPRSALSVLHGSSRHVAGGRPMSDAIERNGLAFVDIETTGLNGGAGICVFLVGIGTLDGTGMTVRQYFLPGLSAERPLLCAVADRLHEAAALVTFNGKAFDLPMLETRWLMHRMTCPFASKDHFDFLHPARRLWKRRSGAQERAWAGGETGCSLGALERALLDVHRQGDVPGFEIPARYFAYVRSGDPRPLVPVLEHNRLDLLSLAALTALALRLVDEGAVAARDAAECLALGRIYERAGQQERAAECYERVAAARVGGASIERREDALFRLGILRRRQRRFIEAAGLWQEIVQLGGAAGPLQREAARAMAVHCEHRSRDLAAARAFALRTLQEERDPRRQAAARHRLSRLDRKLSVQHKGGESAAPLLRA